jgi:hypothetical protein
VLAPTTFAPLGEPVPYIVVVVDDGGTVHLLDMTNGAAVHRALAIGVLEGEPIAEVVGGPVGPLAVRGSLSRYRLVDLDDPWPREVEGEVEGQNVVAHDDETGWSWFGTCVAQPCAHITRVRGYGPPHYDLVAIDLPAPTTNVVATSGLLYAQAGGAIIRIDPATGAEKAVATGTLLDARGSTVVVRSCALDLTCPVYVVDTDGHRPAVRVDLDGDDVQLAPDGNTLVSGARLPLFASALKLFDVANARPLYVDPDALRFARIAFSWSPDGRWLFGATAVDTIVAVRVSDGAVQHIDVPNLHRTIVGLFVRSTDAE